MEQFERLEPIDKISYGSSCEPASFADARQAGRRITVRRNMDLRTEMGWISCPGLSRRGRDPDPEPRRKIAEPLLSRTARAAPVTVACSLRARRRNRRRKEWRARLRCAAAPHSSGRVAGEASVTGNPGIDRVLRSPLRGGPRSAGHAVPRASPEAGIAAFIRSAADTSDARNQRT